MTEKAIKISGRYSMTVDGVSQAIFANLDVFFENNPELIECRELFEQCGDNYKAVVKEKKCSCRVPITQWGSTCFDRLFEILVAAKKENHKLVADFLRHITRLPEDRDMRTIGVTVAYMTKSYEIFIDTSEDT